MTPCLTWLGSTGPMWRCSRLQLKLLGKSEHQGTALGCSDACWAWSTAGRRREPQAISLSHQMTKWVSPGQEGKGHLARVGSGQAACQNPWSCSQAG